MKGIDPADPDYRNLAFEKLKVTDFKKYAELWPDRRNIRVHHHSDGSLQFIDKELHEAFQHTGPHAIAKAIEAAGASALMLVPGAEKLKEGKLNEAAREAAIEVTPFSFSKIMSDGLGSFFDWCEREIFGEEYHQKMEKSRKEFWEKRN